MEQILLDWFDFDVDLNIMQVVFNNLVDPVVLEQRNLIHPIYNAGYINVIPNYNLSEFKSHFRLSRGAVAGLCNLVAPYLIQQNIVLSIETKVLFFLWMLAKQESFLATSDRFGFSKGTGHYVFYTLLEALIQLKQELIIWPNVQKRREIQDRIQRRSGFPGVVGFIDGCHIAIKQPVHNAIDYYNRKEYHSIILQGVCDDQTVFTDVFIGMPGRVHDARVFRHSPLYRLLTDNPPLLTAEEHLLGDAAYPLLQCLLKPFRDNGHMTQQQIRFNQVLAAQRQTIERAFGLLKGRWRRLKYLDMSLADRIPDVVLAACMLHNFAILHDHEENLQNYEDELEIHENGGNEEGQEDQNNAAIKRDYICTLL